MEDSFSLNLRYDQYLELEKIGLGAFSPLDHFMTEVEFISVCKDMSLPSGEVFTIPVVFDVDERIARLAQGVKKISLFFRGEMVGEIFPESIYRCDKDKFVTFIFGVSDRSHPGVDRFYKMGEWFIGGRTSLLKRLPDNSGEYELTPSETKLMFKARGWKKIVGFQTRNVPHRAHEYLQRVALENVDGLFIQPLIGQKKIGDYTAESIIKAYEVMLNQFYPRDRVALGVLSTSMRYAGPREAVFHALIRKNYGCTHFIVGRDHAGVGNYYEKYGAHDLLKTLEARLGISIMYLHGPYYCNICSGIVTEHTCRHSDSHPHEVEEISGTLMRKILSGGSEPDEKFLRSEVLAALHETKLFIEEGDL